MVKLDAEVRKALGLVAAAAPVPAAQAAAAPASGKVATMPAAAEAAKLTARR